MSELTQALDGIGGLSKTSKMPWYSFGIPATECKVGSKLAQIEGTVCHGCYALKGFYRMHNVKNALYQRLFKLESAHRNGKIDEWIEAFVTALKLKHKRAKGEDRFRWHDSGDLQGAWHLDAICEIARRTPFLRHYLPTKEYQLVSKYPKDNIPPNLYLRVSHPKVGYSFKDGTYAGFDTSTVGFEGDGVKQCPAYTQGGECQACDSCWRSGFVVNYKEH